MIANKVGEDIPQFYAEQYGIYKGELAHIDAYQEVSRVIKPVEPRKTKLSGSVREVIEKTGLKDSTTTSLHHHFREGDYVMNLVLTEIIAMRLKNILIAPSLIASVREPLIEHIKNGVATNITPSGLRDKVGATISAGIMGNPVMIRSRGGRVRAVATGDIYIDVAFLDAPSSNAYGNANGTKGKTTCGSFRYAIVDIKYTNWVIITTDTLVPYPNTPINIPQTDVDYVIEIDTIGDPDGIARGATCSTKNPKELSITGHVAKIITYSPYYKEGLSFQAGTGGFSLAVTRFTRKQMLKDGIKASFALDGITSAMTGFLEEGLVEKTINIQGSDHPSTIPLGENTNRYEIDANTCVSLLNKRAVINQLDTAILSVLKVDTDFNVSVITGSDGVIHGVLGGHSDTSMACKMSLVIAPLVRERVPAIAERTNTVVTPGTSVDIIVTGVDIAINPRRTDLIDCFRTLDVPQLTLEELKDKAYNIVGTPELIKYGDKVVTLIEYRDGSLIDVVRNV